jgi:peptide/nickel transport system ATP-binding protein
MSAATDDVRVHDLRVEITSRGQDIVDEVSFAIAPGEVLGLVGESGSGKTTIGLALLGHCRRGARIADGIVTVGIQAITGVDPARLRALRGSLVAYIPQDPGTALNPSMRLGEQLGEMLSIHVPGLDAVAREARMGELLRDVALPDTPDFRRRYPHQVSGGQQQRLAIAMAFACRPRLIVLDEPTTGLDVTTQAHVLRTVRDLCARHGVAALYVSHDLAVVSELAQRVAVMYAGRLVESGTAAEVFAAPRHPYTRRLLQAMPDPEGRHQLVGIPGHAPGPGHRPEGCFFKPRCDLSTDLCDVFPPETQASPSHMARCWHQEQPEPEAPLVRLHALARAPKDTVLSLTAVHARYGPVPVLHDINFAIAAGECLALVGQSGSGKTTLARSIAGLHRDVSGEMTLTGAVLPPGIRQRPAAARRRIQYIFQNPYASLNPRRTVGEIVARPLRLFAGLDAEAARARVVRELERVSLHARLLDRYPDQLSGGERQRVAIARALAAEPALLICDEVTSALDVSVQAAVMALLSELRTEMNLAMLFVTHNLTLVRSFADRVAVMNQGRIVEMRETAAIFEAPEDAYTRALLADTPGLGAVAA